jgi:hypothetical protein
VAEWIRAEAGTGASIESGSQICGPNWADFIKAQAKKKKEIKSRYNTLKERKFTKTFEYKKSW